MTLVHVSEFKEFDPQRYISKLLHDSERVRVVLFCLESGQEVSPHTSSSEVVFYVLEGSGRVMVGEEEMEANAGSLISCPPQVPHGLRAENRLVVLAHISPRP